MAGSPAYAQAPPAGDQKVSAAVRAAAATSDKITFWVTFHARANLDNAKNKRTKADRAGEVRRLLLDTATTSQSGVRHLLKSAGADYRPYFISNRIRVTGSPKLLAALNQRPEVKSIEEGRTVNVPAFAPAVSTAPNAVEWGIARINAPGVWTDFGARGESIVVANIDTGAQFDHPALVAKYRGNLGGGVFDHNYNWFDPSSVCPTDAPCDNHGHGTHTMGTMVGDDGAGNQIGVAPGARFISVKGCEVNTCSDAALFASGEWILAPTDLNGANPRPELAPDIVNNSWGDDGFDPFYQDIVDAWNAAGIFPAFSNGNEGPACNTSGSPGMYLNSYSSGAFDINNVIADFSSRGPGLAGDIKPNLAAPGVNVRSSIPGNSYATANGTSMASPHTAATVALLWSAAPALHGDIGATRALLDGSAIDVDATTCGGTAADNNVFGEGRLDAYAAVGSAPRGPLGGLNGTITSGGAPLAGVTVLADGPIDRVFTTGADGTYSFPILSVGNYVVTASKYGFVTATGNATIAESVTATLDLSLTAAASAVLSGVVTSDTSVVAGASVRLAGTPLETVTNAAGFYSITAPLGTYQLVVVSSLRCAEPVTETVTLNADLTHNVDLPARTDSFGYACGVASGTYPSVSTLFNLTGDDAQASITLPFPVPFYGVKYTSASVSTNGNVAFGAASATQVNTALPDTGLPNGAIYPLWDDWIVDSNSGIFTGVLGVAPHRRFVIEWRNVVNFFDSTQRLSFVAEIGEDGAIVFRYKEVTGSGAESGVGATIGLENAAGTVGFQYSLNTSVITDGTAIAFRTTKHGVIRGTVTDANDGLPVAGATVAFDQGGSATTAADGSYLVQIPSGARTVSTSKAGYESATQTVNLGAATVELLNPNLRTARITATPAIVEVVVPVGQSRVRTITVRNTGTVATPVAVSEFPESPWLGASIAATTLAPGQSTTVTITVDSTGLAAGGVYTAALRLASESGREPNLLVPVRLIVPGFQWALDAGSNNTHVDPSGDTWTKDLKFVAGTTPCGYLGSATVVTTNRAISGSDDPARFANARQNMYEYRCDGLQNGTYTVELNFAELTNTRPNRRVFDVMIEGVEVLPNLDINLETGGNYRAMTRIYTVTVTDGVVNIRFITHSGFGKPIVSALRVTHRPDLA